MIKRFGIGVLIFCLLLPAQGFARKHKKIYRRPLVSAKAAFLWDVTSGKTLFEKNVRRPIYPASTTKIMTALIVLETLPLDKMVTVSASAIQVPETKLDLRVGEQYSVRDLLFAVLLKSANDAANVLAEAVSGSQMNFVVLMNIRARNLGASQTVFSNASGLPSASVQYTTARDMTIIMQEALKNPVFSRIISFKYRVIYSKDGRRHFLKSHNRALFMNWKKEIYGKTGFTQQAQSCFVGNVSQRGRTFIIAVFGSNRRWEDVKFIVERYGKVDL